MREFKDLVDAAARAAERAATFLRRSAPPGPGAWIEKGPRDFVTDVDREAERLITATLAELLPGSSVVGEELAPALPHSDGIVWIVDPLDGTTNYLHGYPQYAVSIGCAVRGELCAGVVHDVPRDVVYWAARGQGAWAGKRRLAVSGVTDPRHALVGTGFPYRDMDQLQHYLAQLSAVVRSAGGVRRAGSASLDLADVAQGRFAAFWELSLAPWDIAAGAMLVREAGGVVTTLEGASDVLRHGSIVAGNPATHEWLMDLLRSA